MALINGTVYDGGSIEVAVKGVGEISGIDAISWGFSNAKVKTKGTGRVHTGQTKGLFNVDDGSMDVWLYEFQNWQTKLGGPQAMTETPFEITVKYIDQNEDPIIYTFKQCRVVSVASTNTISAEENIVKNITWSALNMVDNS